MFKELGMPREIVTTIHKFKDFGTIKGYKELVFSGRDEDDKGYIFFTIYANGKFQGYDAWYAGKDCLSFIREGEMDLKESVELSPLRFIILRSPNGTFYTIYADNPFTGDFTIPFDDLKVKEEKISPTHENFNGSYLDKEEYRYLYTLVRPYRDKISYIMKTAIVYTDRIKIFRLVIVYNDGNMPTYLYPFKNKPTFYEGMELEKKYNIKDLKLDDDKYRPNK
jgi:hypothetical protein